MAEREQSYDRRNNDPVDLFDDLKDVVEAMERVERAARNAGETEGLDEALGFMACIAGMKVDLLVPHFEELRRRRLQDAHEYLREVGALVPGVDEPDELPDAAD